MGTESRYLIPIIYAIKFPAGVDTGFSFINQYDMRALATAAIFPKIACLQKDFAEIFCDKETALRLRMEGLVDGYHIFFFEKFSDLKRVPHVFKVVFTDEIPPDGEFDMGTIIVSTAGQAGQALRQLQLSDITPEILKERLLNASALLDQDERAILDELRGNVGFESNYARISAELKVSPGFYNRANMSVFDSLRVRYIQGKTSNEFLQDEVEQQLAVIAHIRKHIRGAFGNSSIPPAVDFYFSDLSCSLDFANNRSAYSEPSLRNQEVDDAKALVAAIKHAEKGNVDDGTTTNEFVSELEQERLLLDGLIALAAAANVAPVIKLPICTSKIFSDVNVLASADRGNGKKVNAMMRRLRRSFSPYLETWLEYVETWPSAALKFVSNLPLEWAYHQGLPLMVRHEVSRIPVTPGYVASRMLIDSGNVHLELQDFHEILFISSFKEDDPIRHDLKRKLDIINEVSAIPPKTFERFKTLGLIPPDFQLSETSSRLDIRIKWIEVENKKELIDAINDNPCAVTVFDMHGSHTPGAGGAIHLKDEAVSVFDIGAEVRVSPIVILSACDTSPVDKGHETSADAFFLAGAKTVIASALPIQSDLASTFAVRLIERIRTYLPIRVSDEGRPIRWSTLVSGMIRRTYYYELVNLLQKRLQFDNSTKSVILMKVGMRIDPLSPGWAEAATSDITTTLGIDANYLEEFVSENLQFLECMKYLQLGRPENIIVSARRSYDDRQGRIDLLR